VTPFAGRTGISSGPGSGPFTRAAGSISRSLSVISSGHALSARLARAGNSCPEQPAARVPSARCVLAPLASSQMTRPTEWR
jgi:hypothetical protein